MGFGIYICTSVCERSEDSQQPSETKKTRACTAPLLFSGQQGMGGVALAGTSPQSEAQQLRAARLLAHVVLDLGG